MKKIKNLFNKLKLFIKSSPKEVLTFGIFAVAVSVFFIGNAFAALTPIKSVIITSQKSSYEENEPGSWQVEKSGKWIAKGKARVSFDVDTTLMTKGKNTDIIFVLDISGSMSGNKLDRVKQDSTELIDSLLSNKNNNVALITFDTGSTIVSDFTNDKDYLINAINNLEDTGSTNYYQPLVNVDKILKDYVKTNDKEVIVLFLTDGYPNVDVPNQIAQYQTLKKNYPYITVNGIQYEMGETILDPIKEISDNQFFADMETLNNVLFDASVAPIPYDEFQIIDYVDNRYFTLESEDDITVSEGSVKLEEENGKQKITWTIPYLKSGRDAKLTMDIVLKDEYIGQGGIYPTNESEEIISKIENAPDEDVSSTKTPVLADNYKVIYDGNSPDGSGVSNVPEEVNYSVFDTVSLTSEEPSCIGYEFKGWEIVNKDVTRVGEDHFIMPEEDVVIRAKWSKVVVSKSMNGTVNNMGDPIMKRYTFSTKTDYHSDEYKSKVTSIVTKDNLEIPTTAIEYWDVSEAGDGSVIAYAEDDGSGNGTYKVTIGGQGGIIANEDSSYLFYYFRNLENIDLSSFDTSNVTDMSHMFDDCSSLTNLDLSNFNTYNVTNMDSMFVRCESLVRLDVSNFDTLNVTNMGAMFVGCENVLNLDLSNFDTSNVTDMSSMFSVCRKLTSLDLSSFDTSNVTDMSSMFSWCSGLTNLDLSNFDTSNVTDMGYMFNCTLKLDIIDITSFNTSKVTNMRHMFEADNSYVDFSKNRMSNLDVSHFDTSKVTDMSYMFGGCNIVVLDLSHFDTSKVTDMSYMFWNCNGLNSLDLSKFDTSKVTDMYRMFSGCGSLTDLNVSNFDTLNVTDMSSMFYGCSKLTSLDLSSFDTSSVTNMSSMFRGCSGLTDLNVSNFDTLNVTTMSSMFYGCSKLTSLDLSSFDTSSVTNMSSMFRGCSGLTDLNVSNFDTLNVTTMSSMFYGCSKLNSLDLSSFDTSSATTMGSMFYGCSSLTDLDLSDFDTSSVTNMGYMFCSCSGLTNLNVSNFDTSKVTDMSWMFSDCSSLTDLDLSDSDTSSVTNMSWMFYGCSSLTDLDLSHFDTSKVTNLTWMFYGCGNLYNLNMRNADFNSVVDSTRMFYSVNSNINVIVKDSEAESFVRARLDEEGMLNATVTIANPTSQTSLFELGPREFGHFYLVSSC